MVIVNAEFHKRRGISRQDWWYQVSLAVCSDEIGWQSHLHVDIYTLNDNEIKGTYHEEKQRGDKATDVETKRMFQTKRGYWWNNPVSRDNALQRNLIATICTLLISLSHFLILYLLLFYINSLAFLHLYHGLRGVQTKLKLLLPLMCTLHLKIATFYNAASELHNVHIIIELSPSSEPTDA
jgi:hypothetical protein